MQGIYVISNETYMQINKYKVGKHTGNLTKLISRYKTYLIDPIICFYVISENYSRLEYDILQSLKAQRIKDGNGKLSEWVIHPLPKIINTINVLVNTYNEYNYNILQDIPDNVQFYITTLKENIPYTYKQYRLWMLNNAKIINDLDFNDEVSMLKEFIQANEINIHNIYGFIAHKNEKRKNMVKVSLNKYLQKYFTNYYIIEQIIINVIAKTSRINLKIYRSVKDLFIKSAKILAESLPTQLNLSELDVKFNIDNISKDTDKIIPEFCTISAFIYSQILINSENLDIAMDLDSMQICNDFVDKFIKLAVMYSQKKYNSSCLII